MSEDWMTEEERKSFEYARDAGFIGMPCNKGFSEIAMLSKADARIRELEEKLARSREFCIYEDELSEPFDAYDAWFDMSKVVEGVRMGPSVEIARKLKTARKDALLEAAEVAVQWCGSERCRNTGMCNHLSGDIAHAIRALAETKEDGNGR